MLTIAVCTYFILANHKHATAWVKGHRAVVFGLPVVLSTLWASIGLVTAGYGDIGAWCWFTSDEVRLLANFVPRWVIVALMLGMYLRLSVVLRRARAQFVSFEDDYAAALPLGGAARASSTVAGVRPPRPALKKVACGRRRSTLRVVVTDSVDGVAAQRRGTFTRNGRRFDRVGCARLLCGRRRVDSCRERASTKLMLTTRRSLPASCSCTPSPTY